MHGVGFEPTRFATPHLECGPLDRSGIRAGQSISLSHQFITLMKESVFLYMIFGTMECILLRKTLILIKVK